MRRALLLTLVAMTVAAASSDAQVIVSLLRPPPNQLRMADLWKITLTNTTGQTLQVYLRGFVTEVVAGQIADAQSKVFSLPPGTHFLTGNDVSPITVNEAREPYKGIATATGTVPSGEYEVCVYVKLASNDEDLGHDCYTQRIEQVTPSIPVSPGNESYVMETWPTFVWTPPVPLPDGIRPEYTIRIVEVIGEQTGYDAMTSNPAWYTRDGILTSIFVYPTSARSFQVGKRYAWQISARAETLSLGESEIWSFTYGPNPDDPTLNDDE